MYARHSLDSQLVKPDPRSFSQLAPRGGPGSQPQRAPSFSNAEENYAFYDRRNSVIQQQMRLKKAKIIKKPDFDAYKASLEACKAALTKWDNLIPEIEFSNFAEGQKDLQKMQEDFKKIQKKYRAQSTEGAREALTSHAQHSSPAGQPGYHRDGLQT